MLLLLLWNNTKCMCTLSIWVNSGAGPVTHKSLLLLLLLVVVIAGMWMSSCCWCCSRW
jgi:hypothetical protein